MLEMPEIYFSFSYSLYEQHPRMSFFYLFHGLHVNYREGGHLIIHNTVNFETLKLVAGIAGNYKNVFYKFSLSQR